MDWLEFNIHIRNSTSIVALFEDAVSILLDFLEPFVNSQRGKFAHWHYLLEPDTCRGQPFGEIRVRLAGTKRNLAKIKNNLTTALAGYVQKSDEAMCEDEHLGSHTGCHGRRGESYRGLQSEDFGRDWETIVEILQVGSENALELLQLGRNLVEDRSLRWGGREHTYHPGYLSLSSKPVICRTIAS